MILAILLGNILVSEVVCSDEIGSNGKPYIVIPVPIELPNRNDRSDQCWLRIEDVDLTETVTVYCYKAHEFLHSFIHDYNSRKIIEDDVNISLWNEEARRPDDPRNYKVSEKGENAIKDWKVTTVLDVITNMRIYVSKKADCRLIMYTREGMSNYRVDCERVLYFFNNYMNGGRVVSGADIKFLIVIVILFRVITL